MRSWLVRVALGLFLAVPAAGWDAHGHRTITYLALDGLPADAPAWLRDSAVRHQIANQSNEPDVWRGTRMSALHHENKPDHYIDIENLAQFGLTLESVPPLRNEYLRAMAVSKYVHPEKVKRYDAEKDTDRTHEWPGFLPHAIAEHYAKLQSSFTTVRILEKLNDPARQHQLVQSRANAIYHMGVLSHFVGDAAQPLHTTKHYNGWVGENPKGYTTSDKIHSYIDGGVLDEHGLTYANLRPQAKFCVKIDERNPWQDTLKYIQRSHDLVEPLYRLDHTGELKRELGKCFISERLIDGGETLAAFYAAAYLSSAPDDKQVRDYVRFNNFRPEVLPAEGQPACQPSVAGETVGRER